MEDMGNYGYTLFRTIPCFRKKYTFQGVGTTVFGKNARSKGLDDGLLQKRQLFGTEIGH